MLRVISLIVPLALLILATACGNSDTPVPTATATVPAIPTPTSMATVPGIPARVTHIVVPTPTPIAESAKQIAVDIVRDAGVIEQIAGDQPWTASRFFRRSIAGTTDGGMKFDANWDQPVESSGPWQTLNCRDSVTFAFSSTWANITRVHVYVDVEHREALPPWTLQRLSLGHGFSI